MGACFLFSGTGILACPRLLRQSNRGARCYDNRRRLETRGQTESLSHYDGDEIFYARDGLAFRRQDSSRQGWAGVRAFVAVRDLEALGLICSPEEDLTVSFRAKRGICFSRVTRKPLCGEIFPRWIPRLYQSNFLRTCEGLDLFFAGDGSLHVSVRFKVHEAMNAVLACKARHSAFSVLLDSLEQAICDSDVQSSGPTG